MPYYLLVLAKEFKGAEVTDQEIEAIFERFDTDKEGTLDQDEYEIFKKEYETNLTSKQPALEAAPAVPLLEEGEEKKAAA